MPIWMILCIVAIGLQWFFVTICWITDLTNEDPIWFLSKRKILCFYIPLFGPVFYKAIVNMKKIPWKES